MKKQRFKLDTNGKGDEQSHEIFYYSVLVIFVCFYPYYYLRGFLGMSVLRDPKIPPTHIFKLRKNLGSIR